MGTNIIINSDETATCPKCSHQFPIHQGITKQAIERYEKEYDEFVQDRTEELETELTKKAEKKAEKIFAVQISDMKEELENSKEALLSFSQGNCIYLLNSFNAC